MFIDYCLFPQNDSCFEDYLANLDEKIDCTENVKVLKVNVSLKDNCWQIVAEKNNLSQEVLDDFSTFLCQKHSIDKVVFTFADENECLLEFIKSYLLKRIFENHQELCPVLQQSVWQLENNNLNIILDSKFFLERMKKKKIDNFLIDILKNDLNKEIAINFLVIEKTVEQQEQDFEQELEKELEQIQKEVCAVKKPVQDGLIYGKSFKGDPVKISSIQEEESKVIIQGNINKIDCRELRTGRIALKFSIADDTDGINAKIFFESKEQFNREASNIKEGLYVKISGYVQSDRFERNDLILTPKGIMLLQKQLRMDDAQEKRVEFHAHTKMSALDAVMGIKDYIKCAARWGHSAVTITDHGVVQAFPEAYDVAKKEKIKPIFGMEGYMVEANEEKSTSYHIVILAKNQKGLFNLYKLISLSHLKYFYKRPRIPRTLIEEYREGLILGSACEAGDLYQAFLNNQSEEQIEKIASFYDYLEIQPNGNNQFLIRQGKIGSEKELCEINKKIVQLGKKLGKPVIATCDVHFLNPEDEMYRRILQAGQGYSDADEQAPLFFRTTQEMLDEFSYLGEDCYDVVVTNTRKIAGLIDNIKPIPEELYSPQISGAADDVTNMSYSTAKRLYGENLPQIVVDRLKLELNSIVGNGFSELYLIAHKLVKKSLDDGYLVGSRGSVGSSFVATMMNITEVNPLQPHYRCAKCNYSEFITDGSYGSGFDLPDKACPHCSENLQKDGHDIPFAVFLGFHGDKVPDIDLNFSGEYQAQAHKYTEELFGRANVFRAGTISTIADKTAAGFAKKYYEERAVTVRNARIDCLIPGCTGVKRTTGQHPGGIMVVPRDMDVHYFTPVQRPADDSSSDTITTHFDYHSISDRLVKLDILGHDDPTVIKMLEDMIGLSAKDIPFGDEKTVSIFSSTEAIGLTPEQLGSSVATLGIPEFGTRFVRQMLEDTRPKCFSELVRISGYSHGTDVWIKNAQDLIKDGIAKVSETIAARDDIMIFLMQKGVEPLTSFKVMEDVRKGKGVKDEYQKQMRSNKVPEWYIESCNKIKYMFPKAHAVAYVMMAYRIAYCKVYHPVEFYAAYFSIRADDFDAQLVMQGTSFIKNYIKQVEDKGKEASEKEKRIVTILELAYEMQMRGINFKHVDVYKSDATKFLIFPDGILPPLTALAGLGKNAAENICKARECNQFISKDDFRLKTGISKPVLELLTSQGCLDSLPDSNQISLF